jgi:hypothetical protein
MYQTRRERKASEIGREEAETLLRETAELSRFTDKACFGRSAGFE